MHALKLLSFAASTFMALEPRQRQRLLRLLPFARGGSLPAGAFAAGVAVGAGATLLFAPMSGETLRAELMQWLSRKLGRAVVVDDREQHAGEGARGVPLSSLRDPSSAVSNYLAATRKRLTSVDLQPR